VTDIVVPDIAAASAVLHDTVVTSCIFDSGVVVDLDGERGSLVLEPVPPLPRQLVPSLAVGARLRCKDTQILWDLPEPEPELTRHPGATLLRRRRRQVSIVADGELHWQLVSAIDGTRNVDAILASFPDTPAAAEDLLALLVACGAVETSGRSLAEFLHRSTKKGAVTAPCLSVPEILHLLTDGEYVEHPGAPRVALPAGDIPPGLSSFYELTRSRRSPHRFADRPVHVAQLARLLETACGITGAGAWEGRRVGLRAYPSSGGLYTVEIYPVVLNVDGLPSGTYHYLPATAELEQLGLGDNRDCLMDCALPDQRAILENVAVQVCLVGNFPRHERKYGPGGYRMMAAEAGHISQNLILAATALDLRARPCGGFFDELLNRHLGLQNNDRQFLLSVLLGHPKGSP